MSFIRLPGTSLRAAIIDLDGTMVDTLGDFAAALDAVLGDLGLPAIDPQVIEKMVGKGSDHLVRSVLAHVGAAPGLYDKARAAYQAHYRRVNGRHSRLYPGVMEGLQGLRDAGLRLACLTNKPTAFATALLEAKGLHGFFGQVFGGDAFERSKPDPLPVIKTCEALATAPNATLVVGDSGNDARAARGAGCPVVLVTYGYNHGRPAEHEDADGWAPSLAGVAAAVRPICPAALP